MRVISVAVPTRSRVSSVAPRIALYVAAILTGPMSMPTCGATPK